MNLGARFLATFLLVCAWQANATDVYILAGQSNMVGAAYSSGLTSAQLTIPGISKVQITAMSGNCSGLDYSGSFLSGMMGGIAPSLSNQVGPEQGIAFELAKGASDVVLLKFAYGGTGLERDWLNPGGVCGTPLYDIFRVFLDTSFNRLKKSSPGFHFKGVFWMQGEADGVVPIWASKYLANMKSFHARLKDTLSRLTGTPLATLPFVYGVISNNVAQWPNASIVQTAQMRLEEKNPREFNCAYSSRELPRMANETAHYTADSYFRLGQEMSWKMAELLAGKNSDATCGKRPSSIYRFF